MLNTILDCLIEKMKLRGMILRANIVFSKFFSNQFDVSEFQKVNTIIKILSIFYGFYGVFSHRAC